jgi:preprotein translocase subunit SecG
MDFISGTKNVGSAAGIGSSGSDASAGSGGGSGIFSSFSNLSLQKMVMLLAMIAFVISVGTVAILLWKSKSSQKWPPEISKCPDRMIYDSATSKCTDPYGLGAAEYNTVTDNCANYNAFKLTDKVYSNVPGSDGYIPWEGILDGKASKSASLKCL